MMRPFYFDEDHSLHLTMAVETLSTPQNGSGIPEARLIMELEAEGTYARRPPIYWNAEAAKPDIVDVIQQCFAQLTQWHQPVELFEFPNASVVGQGSVVTNQRHLIKESVLEFVAHGLAPDEFVIKADGTYMTKLKQGRFIESPCLLAKRPWYQNYGHWLVDSLTVIALAADLIRINKWKIVIGKFSSAGMRRAVLDSIAMIFQDFPVEVIEHPDNEVWFFDRLYYMTPTHVPPLFKSPTGLEKLRSFSSAIETNQMGRRIFVSRNTSTYRRLVNENEVFDMFTEYGFEFVNPEKLSFNEQVKLFAEADMIAGVKGAALTNCIFSPRGMKVLVLCPSDFPDMFFWDFIAQLDGHYAEVYGPITTNNHQSHNDFFIPVEACKAALQQLLR